MAPTSSVVLLFIETVTAPSTVILLSKAPRVAFNSNIETEPASVIVLPVKKAAVPSIVVPELTETVCEILSAAPSVNI